MSQPTALPDFLSDLRAQISGEVRTDPYDRLFYSTDASIYQVMPYAVMIPGTPQDMHAAVELAAQYRIPLVARGAGSSLAGQVVNEALIIDTSRHLDAIVEVNTEERWARVQPGLVLDEFNIHLRAHGLMFGPDPASSNRATMGGIVSNNSTGSHSILYGMTADHVLEAQVILADGSQIETGPMDATGLARKFQLPGLEGSIYRRVWDISQKHADTILAGTPRHWRRCGGYNLDRFISGASFKVPADPRFNLARLFCGAEGTLGIITELKLNLVPLPEKTGLAILHFDDLFTALSSVAAVLETGPSAVELMDNLGLTMCRDVPEYARLLNTFLDGQPNCILITEFYGESQAELLARVDHLKEHLAHRGVPARVVPAIRDQIQQNVWTVRKVGLGLMMSIKGDHKPVPFIEDAAVPVEHLAEYVTRIEQFCNDLGTEVAYYAHASAGCVHIRPLINTKDASDVAKLPEITKFSVELLGQYGGALSSEHGDGRARSWINERFFGPELYRLFRQIKHSFDPHGVLNPGNIVDGSPITENLRYGPDYRTLELSEHLDFRQEQGFHRAIEMCNGAGICRKRTTGTMCPSFMVTREEEHSTRGRANALRAALAGGLPHSELRSERMYAVMDLCIECKACKAECPSSVDMAKIKFEFLAHYYEEHPIPWRSRLFGDIALMNRLGAGRLAPLANGVLALEWVKRGLERFWGISQQRTLPKLTAEPYTTWYRKNAQKRRRTGDRRASVVLFHDTFNSYNSPEIAIAATRVLEAAGFDVQLPGHRCCGRPMISKGLMEQARRMARHTVDQLAPYARSGVPIIGLEPSCLLTLRDEYLSLLPDDPAAQAVAGQALLFEEFVTREEVRPVLEAQIEPVVRPILLHGHCHQKALIGTGPTRDLLHMTGADVSEVDSGCCGMAGSFGYEVEHYEISMRMAERRLLPAVREVDESTIVVAPGVSCRAQIEHGSGRRALHPAEVIAQVLPSLRSPQRS